MRHRLSVWRSTDIDDKRQDKISDIQLIIINRWQQAANYSAQMAGESLLYWPSFPPLKSVFVILMCLVETAHY